MAHYLFYCHPLNVTRLQEMNSLILKYFRGWAPEPCFASWLASTARDPLVPEKKCFPPSLILIILTSLLFSLHFITGWLTNAGTPYCYAMSPVLVVTLLALKAVSCKHALILIFGAYLNQFQKMWVKHGNVFCFCVRPGSLLASRPPGDCLYYFFNNHRVCVCRAGSEHQAKMCHVLHSVFTCKCLVGKRDIVVAR